MVVQKTYIVSCSAAQNLSNTVCCQTTNLSIARVTDTQWHKEPFFDVQRRLSPELSFMVIRTVFWVLYCTISHCRHISHCWTHFLDRACIPNSLATIKLWGFEHIRNLYRFAIRFVFRILYGKMYRFRIMSYCRTGFFVCSCNTNFFTRSKLEGSAFQKPSHLVNCSCRSDATFSKCSIFDTCQFAEHGFFIGPTSRTL